MNKFLLTILLSLSLLISLKTPIFAHTYATDGSIGAFLHINPADNPIAGKQSGFYFNFKDTEKKFDPKDCICTARITEADHELYSQNIFENISSPNLTNGTFSYTFPRKGTYELVVTGTSATGAFPEFTLDYDIRVERDSTDTHGSSLSTTVLISTSVVGFAILVLISIFVIKHKHKTKKK